MGSERLAIYSTLYPAARPFFAEWAASVRAQSDRAFELLIGLDGVSVDEATAALDGLTPEWIAGPAGPAGSVRSAGLARAAERCDHLVIVDCDDLLLPTRVAAARAALSRADVSGCALELVDVAGRRLGRRLTAPAGCDLSTLIAARNVFGLSNTAWRTCWLRRALPAPASCDALDWLLVSRAVLLGARLSFDSTPRMLYRRYDGNVAALGSPFDRDTVLDMSRRAVEHYGWLLDDGWPVPAARRALFDSARARAVAFDAAVRGNPATLERYLSALNRLPAPTLWWASVAAPELDGIWQTSSSVAAASATANHPM